MCHGTFLRLLLTGNGSDISKLTFFQSQLTTKQKHLTGTGLNIQSINLYVQTSLCGASLEMFKTPFSRPEISGLSLNSRLLEAAVM